MLQRSQLYLVIVCFLFVLLALPAFAADSDEFALRLWGEISPFISGHAGSGTGAPSYYDAFDTGLGAGVEASWRFTPRLSFLAGIGYEKHGGSSHRGIYFDDLSVVPAYLGGKVHISCDVSHWDPYLRVDIGAARLSSVDVSYQGLKGKYWDASWVFLADAGAGVEYRWNRWGASLEVKIRYLGKPDSAMGYPSDAGSSWSIPVVFGINYHF